MAAKPTTPRAQEIALACEEAPELPVGDDPAPETVELPLGSSVEVLFGLPEMFS